MKKARVGLIIDDKPQPWNIYDLIRKSHQSEIYVISCLIVQENHRVKRKKISKSINEFFFKVIVFFERIFVKRFTSKCLLILKT